jgi:hypothetical protein
MGDIKATEADKYILDAALSSFDVQLETSTLFRHFSDRILDWPLVLTVMLVPSVNFSGVRSFVSIMFAKNKKNILS